MAKENARLNKVDISFFQSDLLETIDYRLSTIDLIISNPPYVASEDIDKLQPEISYEPLIALDGGSDGLGFYRRVIKEAPNYLKAGGLLIMEMGFKQNSAINNIFENSGNFKIIEIVKDYNHIDRVIIAKKLNKYG